MILGATNNPWAVDSAAMRPGRFSQKIYIPLPDDAARRAMLKARLAKVKTDGNIDIEYAVTLTDGYSGADIAELIDRATDLPLKRSLGTGTVSGLTQTDMEAALASIKPSVDAATLRRFAEYEND